MFNLIWHSEGICLDRRAKVMLHSSAQKQQNTGTRNIKQHFKFPSLKKYMHILKTQTSNPAKRSKLFCGCNHGKKRIAFIYIIYKIQQRKSTKLNHKYHGHRKEDESDFPTGP